MVFTHHFRPSLLRTVASELCGAKGRNFQQIRPSRLASTWMQDAHEMSGTLGLSGRIHILGVGNIGTFVAHSLASRPSPPPITLLMHHAGAYSSWLSRKECLTIQSNGLDDSKTGFDVNVFHEGTWRSLPFGNKEDDGLPVERLSISENIARRIADLPNSEEDKEPIECLIVSVKAPVTAMALENVCHRLTPQSTVLFLQNGMGAIEEINEKVFPDPSRRPHYMFGIISHGLYYKEHFYITQAGVGTMILGPELPRNSESLALNDKEPEWAPSTKYLLRTLTLTPPLVAVAEPSSSLLLHQLEKLAMNSIINPLTVLLNCHNGDLLYNYSITRVMRLLLFEISSVICSLPELQGIPGIESRFSPERLRGMAMQLANKTAKNKSSMLQDVLAGKVTEIEYMNGYIVRRGEELGIKCVVNYMIKHLVIAKQQGLKRKESTAIPFDLTDDFHDTDTT
ncbi:ketopantoate reductase PanE/ApbA C terminal-domain-containing protein [Aspergillus cavernicola]|uniref:2-dehydropantoate 2-reductase n=1 Tax=Aspergillus cavernicola TaxID=176166 RepID=A0ABR4IU73_9EURO